MHLPAHLIFHNVTFCVLWLQVAKDSALALELAQQLDKHHNMGSAHRNSSSAGCAVGIDAVLSASAAEIDAFPDFASIASTLEAHDSDNDDDSDDGGGGSRPTASPPCPQKSREVARLDLIVSYLADVHSVDYFGGQAYADNGAMCLGQKEVHRRFRSILDQLPIATAAAVAGTRPSDSAPEKRARLETDSAESSGSNQSATRRSKWGDWNGPWVREIQRMLRYLSKEETERRASFQKTMLDACTEKLQSVTRQFCATYCQKQGVQGSTEGSEGESSESWVVTWPLPASSAVRLAAPLSNDNREKNAGVLPAGAPAGGAPSVPETNCVGSDQVPETQGDAERNGGVPSAEESTPAGDASKVADGEAEAISETTDSAVCNNAETNAEQSPEATVAAADDALPPKPVQNTFASADAAHAYVISAAASRVFDEGNLHMFCSFSFCSHSHCGFHMPMNGCVLDSFCRFR